MMSEKVEEPLKKEVKFEVNLFDHEDEDLILIKPTRQKRFEASLAITTEPLRQNSAQHVYHTQ